MSGGMNMDADQIMQDIRADRSWEATFEDRWAVFAGRLATSLEDDNASFAAANPGGRVLNSASVIDSVRVAPADREIGEFRMRISPA